MKTDYTASVSAVNDKRRCVEIALREFPNLSSRALAELCGVGDRFVRDIRGDDAGAVKPHVTGADGKRYPAARSATAGAAARRKPMESRHEPEKTTHEARARRS